VQVTGAVMSVSRVLRYAIQFAQGMNYLHTCKPPILHRDLKPANLLLDFSQTLKVADFGLAKLRPIATEGAASADASAYISFQMTGETGSYRFMAPEVYLHKAYGRPVDVYSFAMITFNMLLGEPPWAELPGPEAAKAAALHGERPPVPRHWDADLAQLLRSCWAGDPKLRPSFAAVLEVLNKTFHSSVGTTYQESLDAPGAAGGSPQGCCALM